MSDETGTETAAETQVETEAVEPKTFDAEYVRKLRDESAKYRTQAKENSGAATRLAEIEEAAKSDAQKLTDRATAAEAKVTAFEAAAQIATWKADVSTETGVPIAALSGSTLEELTAHAAILKPLIAKAEPDVDDGRPHTPYRDLSKVLADAPKPQRGLGTLRAAYASHQ
jgi:hypothetical protein